MAALMRGAVVGKAAWYAMADFRSFSRMSLVFSLLVTIQLLVALYISTASQKSLLDRSYFATYNYLMNGRGTWDESASQMLQFVQNEASFISQVYHDESFPALKLPSEIFNGTVPLYEYCDVSDSDTRPRYAVFRNAMLVGRQLLLPGAIDCRLVPMSYSLSTVHHPGQNSTPEILARVVPDAYTFEEFEPDYSCHERVYEPAVLFSFINWPQRGHALFNGISLLWEAFHSADTGPLWRAGMNVRLYAYGDGLSKTNRVDWQQYIPFLELEGLQSLMTMFSHQPTRSLATLLMQSERHPICFAHLVVGIPGELDHYNFNVSLLKWKQFALAVKNHFGVSDTPRLENRRPLQRVIPPEEFLNINATLLAQLGDIKPIDWASLPGRPRLVIIDRRENRIILNAALLLQIAKRNTFFKSSEVVYLEDMDLEKQVRLIGVTDVLFGMDGTGLMNGVFMPEGGVVVHVRPYGCAEYLPDKGTNFDRLWAAHPGRVIRYESGDIKSTKFPNSTVAKENPELVFNHNSTQGYRFPFLMKQDTNVDPAAFGCILNTAQKLLQGDTVDWRTHNSCTKTVFQV